jgi:hypothetical protein
MRIQVKVAALKSQEKEAKLLLTWEVIKSTTIQLMKMHTIKAREKVGEISTTPRKLYWNR